MDADLLNAVFEYVEELRGRGEISDSDSETDFGKSGSSMESDRYNIAMHRLNCMYLLWCGFINIH